MTLWAKGLDFKNKANSTRVGGVGVYGQDGQAQKVYLGLGHEPWNNQGLEMTSSTIKFKGNDIYHVGRKPSPAEIGAINKSGDTINGHLIMSPGQKFIGAHNYGYSCNTKEGSIDYVLYIDSDNKVHVGYNGRAMKLDSLDIVNKNNKKIYHEDNKPTPAEIGAINKSGDTMTGALLTKSNSWWIIDGTYGLNLKNSDIFGVNSIVFEDGANSIDEGLLFPKSGKDGSRTISDYNVFKILDNQPYIDGKKVWYEYNDGAGSGLDADLLDGKHWSDIESTFVKKAGDTINGNLTIANNGVLNVGNISLRGRDLSINGKRALVGYSQNDGNLLVINYDKDYGQGVAIKGNVHIQQGALKADNGLDAKFNSIQIPSGQDLNNYQTPGMYYCPADVDAKNIRNVPIGCAFSLLVEAHAGRKQTFTCYWKDQPKTYVRNYYNGAWGNWLIQCDGTTGPNGSSWADKSNYWNKVPFIGTDGVMEVGKYIDFHNSDRDSQDFSVRLEAGTDGKLYCYTGFVGDEFYANKYLRIRDWYGAAVDGRFYYKQDGKQLITENVNVFQSEKLKALGGGITSNGEIYAYQTNIKADRDVICGGKYVSTIISGGANLYCEGRGGGTHGWHFADLTGSYADIYAKIYRQQSDARTKTEVKKDISLLKDKESTLDKISKIKPKEFYYSEDSNKKVLYGFFAQDLEAEFPLTVTTAKYSKEDIKDENMIFPKDKDGNNIHDLKSIDPVAISAIMWDALKEVNAVLRMQKIKNKELLDRIKALEEKNK